MINHEKIDIEQLIMNKRIRISIKSIVIGLIIIFIVVSVTPVSVIAEAGNAEAISRSEKAADILKKYVSNESGTPIDTLDEGCKRHDKCYDRYKNKSKCKCDKDLIGYIDRNIGKMSGKEKTFAKAIRTYFVWKRGHDGCK